MDFVVFRQMMQGLLICHYNFHNSLSNNYNILYVRNCQPMNYYEIEILVFNSSRQASSTFWQCIPDANSELKEVARFLWGLHDSRLLLIQLGLLYLFWYCVLVTQCPLSRTLCSPSDLETVFLCSRLKVALCKSHQAYKWMNTRPCIRKQLGVGPTLYRPTEINCSHCRARLLFKI